MRGASAIALVLVSGLAAGAPHALAAQLQGQPSAPSPADDPPRLEGPVAARLHLADAPQDERDVIERLRHSPSWVRRAFAAERLARFDCEGSETYLRLLLKDEAWRVRCFAILALARRQLPIPESAFAKEPELKVIRTALRARYSVPLGPLEELIDRLASSERLGDKVTALELLLASPLDRDGRDAVADARELLGEVIMRMDRTEAGGLSPRLASITAGRDSGRNYKWREWYRKNRKDPGLHGAFVVPAGSEPRQRGPVAELPLATLLDLERHMQDLSTKSIEIAIAIDCTASMSGEIAECQSGIDALMLFAQDVARAARIGIVGYRDQQDDWETRGWDLTASLDEARDRLWLLSAEGGGDRPESVLPGLKLAYGRMSWSPEAMRSVVLVGDAPPRPGTGDQSVELARKAFAAGIRTFTIAPRADRTERERQDEDDLTTPPTDEPEPSAPSDPDMPPGETPPAENPNDRKGPAPWSRTPNSKPTSPWRQKLKPGEVEYWKEIADAGGGRTVGLPRDASLIAEIAGLTLGDLHQEEFESFFASWFALCR